MSIVEHDVRPASVPTPGLARLPRTWAGVVRDLGPVLGGTEPPTLVSAQWIVPEVLSVDPAGHADITVAFWVGFHGGPTGDLLRAGVAARVEPGIFASRVSYHAWTQWGKGVFGDEAVTVTDFPVRAGDTVAVTVRTTRPELGLVSIANLTRNIGTSVGVSAHSDNSARPTSAGRLGIMPAGPAAAWIVEALSADLPSFSPVAFTDCLASTADQVFHLSPGGVATNIIGDPRGAEFGRRLTRTSITAPTTAVVGWNGFA